MTPFLFLALASVAGADAPKPVVAGDPARLERVRKATMPKFDKPIMFDTPEADAILAALEVFPPDNPWNLVVGDWPLHPKSKQMIAGIGAAKPLRCNPDMGFILIPPGQKAIAGYDGLDWHLDRFAVTDNAGGFRLQLQELLDSVPSTS